MRRLLAAALLVIAAFLACDGDQRYVYTAQAFDPVAGCLSAYAPIETVPGDSVSINCPVACLTVGTTTYLSNLCPPVPDIATETDAETPECQAALDASRLEAGCESEDEGNTGDTGDGGEDEGGDDAAAGDDGAVLDEDSGIADAADAG